ncbi:SDR family oxidoreductase [Seleniivibrio woodruffii]|uniref:SDR family oxidoreductase n=1 Tax=Seleniivibrio woodruffii TaxID=1078050 RepID=UPI002408F77B|nr:SDR family oxidoreductase [Seleniivibrio woodruffii]
MSDKKLCLIIGGSKGTGLVAAKHYLANGWEVVSASRSLPEKPADGIRFLTLKDSSSDSCRKVLNMLGQPVDAVIFSQKFRGAGDSWAGELDTGMTLTKNMIEAAADGFFASEASVVIIGSAAQDFYAEEQPVSYHAAKAALAQMAVYYANSLGKKGVRVNGILCGAVKKPENTTYYEDEKMKKIYETISPLGRMCEAEDIAGAAFFLTGSSASYITGHVLKVDGGISTVSHESLVKKIWDIKR